MSDTYYGSDAKPAYLDPFHTIVEISFPTGGYVVLKLSVFRRILSEAAHNNNVFIVGGPPPPPVPYDTVLETLLSYTMEHPWPWGPGVYYPADPPFDVEPDEAVFVEPNSLQGINQDRDVVRGMPDLPDTNFGLGDFEITGGTIGEDQSQPYLPVGVRFAPLGEGQGGGATDYRKGRKGVPAPPEFGGKRSRWISELTRSIELYEVLSETGGATLKSFYLSFFDLEVKTKPPEESTDLPDRPIAQEELYRAVATAHMPREEGAVKHDPPFTGEPTSQNANNRAEIWVLLKSGEEDEPEETA